MNSDEAKNGGKFCINLKKQSKQKKFQTETRKREWNFDSISNSDDEMADQEQAQLSDDELQSCFKNEMHQENTPFAYKSPTRSPEKLKENI
jgi:tRNA 2-selenouridine synthase SelU